MRNIHASSSPYPIDTFIDTISVTLLSQTCDNRGMILPMTYNNLDVFANFINNNKSSSSHLDSHHCYLETCFAVLTCIITIYTLTRSIYHKVVLYSTRLFFPHDRFFFQYVLLCHIAYHVKKFTAYERDGLLRWLDVISSLHGRIRL